MVTADAIDPTPLDLLARPLDWFLAEHERHRRFCRSLRQAAEACEFDGPGLSALAGFICRDLALHIAEEEEELFPMLRRRARPEDRIDEVLGRLSVEHSADEASAQVALAHLDASVEARSGPGASPGAQRALSAFADQEMRHLALENAVVLPLARLRLSARDLNRLSRALATRRGVKLEAASA